MYTIIAVSLRGAPAPPNEGEQKSRTPNTEAKAKAIVSNKSERLNLPAQFKIVGNAK